ncbi:MAG: polysaccharide deacetylase family protein [Actinomycetota bacterium]|nr:polysaccharide deacetylase family protein [Actinomycetota bacterium]
MPAVLIYHDIVRSGDPDAVGFAGPLAARYKLDEARFEEHLDAIAALDRRVGLVSAGDLPPDVALTFDDGGASAMWAAASLERRGWHGHFFVTTGKIDTPGFLTAADVRALAEAGHSIGSHSHTHPAYMARLPDDRLRDEWTVSRAALADVLGSAPEIAAVPGGSLSDGVLRAAEAAGFRTLMTSQPTRRSRTVGELEVIGRYTIWSTTSLGQVSGYAAGALAPRARLWLEWTAKGAFKRVSPGFYQRARRVRARLTPRRST